MLNDFVDVLPYECWNRVLRQPESFCLSWNAWSTLERNYVYCQDYLVKGPCLERRAISCSRLLSPSIIQSFDNTVRLLYEFGGIKELLSGIPLPTNRLRRWHWNFYSTIGDFCPYVLLSFWRVGKTSEDLKKTSQWLKSNIGIFRYKSPNVFSLYLCV